MKDSFSSSRYVLGEVGNYHGSGIPGQVGQKKGTFTEDYNRKKKVMKKATPRKMN